MVRDVVTTLLSRPDAPLSPPAVGSGDEPREKMELVAYFGKRPPGVLHCTTKFCDYGKAAGAEEYAQQEVSAPQGPRPRRLLSQRGSSRPSSHLRRLVPPEPAQPDLFLLQLVGSSSCSGPEACFQFQRLISLVHGPQEPDALRSCPQPRAMSRSGECGGMGHLVGLGALAPSLPHSPQPLPVAGRPGVGPTAASFRSQGCPRPPPSPSLLCLHSRCPCACLFPALRSP